MLSPNPINVVCPSCGSQKTWRDGNRYLIFGDQIQRWLCRDCQLRFSDPNDVLKAKKVVASIESVESKSLKSTVDRYYSPIMRHGDEKLGCGTTIFRNSAEKCDGPKRRNR